MYLEFDCQADFAMLPEYIILVFRTGLRASIKVNSLIAYDNGADRITERVIMSKIKVIRTNGLGRRGCDGRIH